MARSSTWLLVTLLTGAAVVAACSAFSGSDTSGGNEQLDSGDGSPNAIDGGGTDAEAIADAKVEPDDACAAAVTNESGGLYVLAGQSEGPGVNYGEPTSVLRATIQCDGKLRDWKHLFNIPRTVSAPAGAAIGDLAVYLGGLKSTGGATFGDAVYFARFDGGGALLPPFNTATGVSAIQAWRSIYGSNGQSFFVAGGESPDGSVLNTATLWRVSANGEPERYGAPPLLPPGMSRGAGAMIGNTMVAIGAGAVYTAKDGDATWKANAPYGDTDIAAASDGTTVYVVPGIASGSGTIYSFSVTGTNAASLIPMTPKVPVGLSGPSAVVFRGRLYVIGGLLPGVDAGATTAVRSFRIISNDLGDPQIEAPMPEGHAFSVAFAR